MSRKGHTPVDVAKIEKTLVKAGLVKKENKGFAKWHVEGAGIKRAIGVPTTKQVTRIELVGFESEVEGVVSHPKPPAATVTQMIDFTVDEKLILRAVWKVASSLVAASKKAAEPAAEPATPPAQEPASSPEAAPSEPAAEQAEQQVG